MALTYSPTAALGSPCPPFSLVSVDQKMFSLEDFSDANVLVVMFICNHCPYVKAVEERLIALAEEFDESDAAFVAICSNDPTEHPEDEPAQLFHRWKEKSYPFPYLIDPTQKIAKTFGAVCTPDFFVYDRTRKLRYRGRLDDSWKNESLVKRHEMESAINAILSGESPSAEQIPSMGCSIKWKTNS
jgi:thiol-disulfide isomerase/thioredoxin